MNITEVLPWAGRGPVRRGPAGHVKLLDMAAFFTPFMRRSCFGNVCDVPIVDKVYMRFGANSYGQMFGISMGTLIVLLL